MSRCRVAVDFPETNFVIAHLGNPWLADTSEVVYKNNKPGIRENVWADLSGLMVGSASDYENYRQEGYFEDLGKKVWELIDFTERPDRFLFGSDWPLSPMKVYRDFISELIPESYHKAVFHDNAKALFKLVYIRHHMPSAVGPLGGLSGCTFKEGVSWGKFVSPEDGGRYAEVLCDATIAWPLLLKGVSQRLGKAPTA